VQNPHTHDCCCRVGKGKSLENTQHIEKKKVKRRIKMYRCEICRYVYNPEEGDLDNGMAQGKLFDDLLDD